MNRLEAWKAKGLISILISCPAHGEAEVGGSSLRAAKANSYVISLDTLDIEREELERQIAQILFPQGVRTVSAQRDVQIVAHAKKYGCGLVTADGASRRQPGGILGHRDELRKLVGVNVMTDEEAAAFVAGRIHQRDEAARNLARITGEELPSWVGAD